jgi:CheY-like chemotaxis protein
MDDEQTGTDPQVAVNDKSGTYTQRMVNLDSRRCLCMRTEHAKMNEPSIRKDLQSVLEADGYHVETVSNGKDAISNCRA